PNIPAFEWEQIIAGFISMMLAMMCAFTFELAFSTITFFTNSIQGLNEAKALLVTLASGSLFPLDILPRGLQIFLSLLPFKYIVYTP
ncbi:hypothetical protein OFC00_30570, partial [Escherichia coli]|nr:hypothetical protein [Escherichia coli]